MELDTRSLSQLKPAPVNTMRIIVGVFACIAIFLGGTILSVRLRTIPGWTVVWGLVIMTIIIWAVYRWESERNKAILKFTVANKLESLPQETAAALVPPSLQNQGFKQSYKNMYTANANGQKVALFEYSYTYLSGSKAITASFGIAAFKTEKSYPHIYLDGKQVAATSIYSPDQKLELEGDFNKYFDLYYLDEADVETLSFLAPDVMQILIDTGRMYDIEVSGNFIYLITQPPDIYTQKGIERLVKCINTLLGKVDIAALSIHGQTAGDSTAPRLRRYNNWPAYAAWIIGALVIGMIALFTT